MEQNWNMATNSELKERCEQLTEIYNKAQKQFVEAQGRMVDAANEYAELQEIINKRNGMKSNG